MFPLKSFKEIHGINKKARHINQILVKSNILESYGFTKFQLEIHYRQMFYFKNSFRSGKIRGYIKYLLILSVFLHIKTYKYLVNCLETNGTSVSCSSPDSSISDAVSCQCVCLQPAWKTRTEFRAPDCQRPQLWWLRASAVLGRWGRDSGDRKDHSSCLSTFPWFSAFLVR